MKENGRSKKNLKTLAKKAIRLTRAALLAIKRS